MKKTLLAAALLTGGFAGTAMAQNSVTLYGRLTPGFVFEQVKVPTAVAEELGMTNNGTFNQFNMATGYNGAPSMWGLRGVEDLGNGLKAGFQYERGFSAVTGSDLDPGGNRVAALSLMSDSWGTFKLGRDLSPTDAILAGISPIGTGYGVASPFSNGFGLLSQRLSGMVSYLSPSFNGFSVGLAYSFNGSAIRSLTSDGTTLSRGGAVPETFGTMSKNRALLAGARYSNGPILLAGAYGQYNAARNQLGTSPKAWMIGGAYDFKVVRLHAGYSQSIDGLVGGQYGNFAGGPLGGVSGDDFGTVGAGATAIKGGRSNSWFVGASAPVGDSGQVLFSVGQQRPGGELKTTLTSTQTSVGIAYVYRLSARTSLNASYSYANNLYMLEGVKANQVGLGLMHTF